MKRVWELAHQNRLNDKGVILSAYKKGSLLLHGYDTDDINKEYKCVVVWNEMDKVMEYRYNKSMEDGQDGQGKDVICYMLVRNPKKVPQEIMP